MLFQRYSHRPCPSLTSHHCYRFCSCWAAASRPRQPARPARPRPRSRESLNECSGRSSVARSRPPGSSIVRRRPKNPMQSRLPTALTARPRPRQAKRNVEQKLPAARHGRLQRRQRLLRGRHRKQRSSQRRAITPCPASPVALVPRAREHLLLRPLIAALLRPRRSRIFAVPGRVSLLQQANLHAASLDLACVQALQHLLRNLALHRDVG